MTPKEVFIGLLAKAIAELPEKTETEVKTILERYVGPLADDQTMLTEARDALKNSQALNDKAEALLDKILCQQARGRDSLCYTPSIDGLWAHLKKVREKEGRQLPVAS